MRSTRWRQKDAVRLSSPKVQVAGERLAGLKVQRARCTRRGSGQEVVVTSRMAGEQDLSVALSDGRKGGQRLELSLGKPSASQINGQMTRLKTRPGSLTRPKAS